MILACAIQGRGPALFAQDAPQPLPAGADRVFLPQLQNSSHQTAGDIVPGEYIVVLKDPSGRRIMSPDDQATHIAMLARTLAITYGGDVLFVYDAALPGFAVRTSETGALGLAADPNVAYIEPNRIVAVVGEQSGVTWGIDRIDQRRLPLDALYHYASGGAGVHAYIIDTGIRTTHRELTGRIGNGYTAISDAYGVEDCAGHGTHVAGTVGGSSTGVAKQVTLHPVRVLGCTGSGTTGGVIAGINWMITNASLPAVANMSLGGSASSALDTAVNNVVAHGIVVAVAAGNSNIDACLSSPARATSALTTGATNSTDQRASFSNYGGCLDLFAPGVSITSAYYTADNAAAVMSGTSMASPHVAGVVALYLAACPGASAPAVAEVLTSNATVDNVINSGAGSPNRFLYSGFITPGLPPTAPPIRRQPHRHPPAHRRRHPPAPTTAPTPTNADTATPTATPTPRDTDPRRPDHRHTAAPTPTETPTTAPTPTDTPTTAPDANGNADSAPTPTDTPTTAPTPTETPTTAPNAPTRPTHRRRHRPPRRRPPTHRPPHPRQRRHRPPRRRPPTPDGAPPPTPTETPTTAPTPTDTPTTAPTPTETPTTAPTPTDTPTETPTTAPTPTET
ncbi:MAG: S8 family peptidase [Anaerolineales bacterium]|nr:S8 family peptidase [Anaerolineales bacterium]